MMSQEGSSTKDGLTSPSPLNQRRIRQLVVVNMLASLFLVLVFATVGVDSPHGNGCTENIIDFHVFWAAGRLGLAGTPAAAFDQQALRDTFLACNMTWLPWLHPAPVMLLMAPFATLPFIPAWLLFDAISLIMLSFAMKQFCSPRHSAFIAILFAPALLPALLAGQFTILWIAGLLSALAALRTDRPILAGILIGLLTLKPTLGLLVPIILVAAGHWRTVFVASATTVAAHGIATLMYGAAYWSHWRAVSATHISGTIEEMAERDTMASLASFLARLGMRPETAVTLNIVLAACMGVALFFIWRRLGARSDLAVAVLFAAIPLATPYLWHYDAGFLAIAALFLWRGCDGMIGPVQWFALGLLWLGPGLPVWNAATINISGLIPTWVVPPILLLALGLSLGQAALSFANLKPRKDAA